VFILFLYILYYIFQLGLDFFFKKKINGKVLFLFGFCFFFLLKKNKITTGARPNVGLKIHDKII